MARKPLRLLAPAALTGALALAAPAALAGVCTAQTSGTFGPIGSGTATWLCTSGGGAERGDHLVVPSGVALTIVGDVMQDDVAQIGLVVEEGGALHAVVDPSTGPLRLTLGERGLTCLAGSTCELRGAYRSAHARAPGLRSDRADAEPFRIGELALRSGPTLRVVYPAEARDAALGGPSGALAALSSIVPGDVACFYDPEPGDARAPADDGYCYEVHAVDWSADPPFMELDVRQGRADHPASPIARREIVEAELAAPALAGDRIVSIRADVSSGGVPPTGAGLVGRFLRFAAPEPAGGGIASGAGPRSRSALAPGAAEERGHRILRADLAAAPARTHAIGTVTIGDARGLEAARPEGTRVWIDYGWQPGDPFFVMTPVTVASASPISVRESDTPARFAGAVSLRAALFDAIQAVEIAGPATRVAELRDVWLRDMGNDNSHALSLRDLASDLAVEHLTITGIDASLPRTHSIVARGAGEARWDVRLRDVAIRHHGDDCWSVLSSGFDGAFRAERFRCQHATDVAETCNLLSYAFHTGTTEASDLECVDCVRGKPDTGTLFARGDGPATVRGLLAWGAAGRVGNPSTTAQTLEDVLVLGGGNSRRAPIVPPGTSGCVVRDFGALPGRELGIGVAEGPVEDCIFDDVTVHLDVLRVTELTRLRNVAFIDMDSTSTSGSSAVLRVDHGLPNVARARLSDVTIAFRPGFETRIRRGISIGGATGAFGIELHGMLVAHHTLAAGSTGVPFAIHATPEPMAATDFGGRGPCLSMNATDLSPGAAANAPTSLAQVPDLGFANPALGRFDLLPGSEGDLRACGARGGVEAPGVKRFSWMHAISEIAPERMADDADADGVPEDPLAPPCRGGETRGCSDSCPAHFDPSQADADDDAIGDACDDACGFGRTALEQVSPTPAGPGQWVEILGSGFGPNVAVHFGDRRARVIRIDGAQALAQVPTELLLGTPVAVRVSNPEGCAAAETRPFEAETPPPPRCGMGTEIVVPLWILLWARQRRGRRRSSALDRTHG